MVETLTSLNDPLSEYVSLQHRLKSHSLYHSINSIDKLKIFMEHHVYAVWDFMSLIKSLQQHLAPTTTPWTPPQNARYANFINQLVLEEESDYALSEAFHSSHASHFESYLAAMVEVGANTQPILQFIKKVNSDGLRIALKNSDIPTPAKHFMKFTFDVIKSNQAHLLAAALAYGREDLVPQLFHSLQTQVQVSAATTPILFAYLERHVELDGEEHGPLSIQIMEDMCEDSLEKYNSAMKVAEQSLSVRLNFWNDIHQAIMAQY